MKTNNEQRMLKHLARMGMANSECTTAERGCLRRLAAKGLVTKDEWQVWCLARKPTTCEDFGGDDSNRCHECHECLERLGKRLRHACNNIHKSDEADREAWRLSGEYDDLKEQLEG